MFSFRHLYLAGKRCRRGVGWKNSIQRYSGDLIVNTAKTVRELRDGTFRHRGFHEFDITERGKKRHIRSVHITERVVQRCLCDYYLVPVYSSSFIYDNSASLKGKGVDFAMDRMNAHLQRHFRKHGTNGWILLFDFHNFFDSASHDVLFSESRRRIRNDKIRSLADSFISDFGPVGLGLGSQVSQINALMLPNSIDHYFKDVCRIRGYGRYMDDGYAIHASKERLNCLLDGLKELCMELGLSINEKKTKIIPFANGFRFLKTKFTPTERRRVVRKMNRDSTKIIRRKLRSFRLWVRDGTFSMEDVRSSYNSYLGHLSRGNSWRTKQNTNRYFKQLFGFYPNRKGWELCIR